MKLYNFYLREDSQWWHLFTRTDHFFDWTAVKSSLSFYNRIAIMLKEKREEY